MFTLRPPRPDDVEDICNLMIACDLAELGEPDSDREDVLWRWRLDGFSTDMDAAVVEGPAGMAAYAIVFEGEADVWVHPKQRGLGLGRALARAVEGRAIEQGTSPDGYLRQNLTDRDPDGLSLLRRLGYEESHHYARMEISLAGPVEVPTPPPGVTIRGFDPSEDDRALYVAYMRAWQQYSVENGGTWRPESFERWADMMAGSDFDPHVWHLAERDGRIVGFSLCLNYPWRGWVQSLGVVPEERGRGLGETLLKHSFAVYLKRGVRRVGLTVSSRNLPEARRLYERAGMHEELRYLNLRQEI